MSKFYLVLAQWIPAKRAEQKCKKQIQDNPLTDDKHKQDINKRMFTSCSHYIPTWLDPFTADDSKNHHKRSREVFEVPPWYSFVEYFCCVVRTKQLHSNHSEDKHEYEKDDSYVTHCTYTFADRCQKVTHSFPRLSEFENTKLKRGENELFNTCVWNFKMGGKKQSKTELNGIEWKM